MTGEAMDNCSQTYIILSYNSSMYSCMVTFKRFCAKYEEQICSIKTRSHRN